MRQIRKILAAAAAVTVLTVAYVAVQQRKDASSSDQAMSGELVEYEVSSRHLILRTDTGDTRFVVAGDATVHEGARAMTPADLVSARGWRAKIWYQEAHAQRTAHDIRVLPSDAQRTNDSAAPER